MDVQTLVTVLSAVLSPNEVERKAAEEHLKKAQDAPGHLVMLMQAVVAPTLDPSIRQAASIHFKQLLSKRWKPSESQLKEGIQEFSPEDKQVVRDNVLEAIIQAPPKIRSQLGECLKSVLEHDYPHAWPGLLPLICQNLQMQDLPRLYGALYALRMLANKYEFKDEEERVHIQEVVNTTFPTLLQIFQQLAQHNSAQVELAELMKLICKTFWSSTFLDIPQHLLDPQVFMSWMSVFDQLLAKPVPVEGAPTDPDELKTWPWWKLKKWTLHVINRMFSRFGDSKQLKEDQKEFSKQFRNTCSTKFLGSYLQLLDGLRHGAYLPDRVVNLALQYVMTGVTKSATYKMLKPQLNIILFEIAFPLLCFNENDHMLWVEDPHEYVRKGYDVIEDMYSPRTAAMHLIIELVNFRSKDCLQPFIAFLVDIFTKYNQAAPEAKPYNIKDGALYSIGWLCEKLKITKPYTEALEEMLMSHVLPEFQNPHGHIRAKAAWVSGQYADIKFKDPQNFISHLQCIVGGLRDPDLPVRVDSVVALRNFVDASPKDLNEIRPILPQLLDELFKLMNEVENEDLVFTLETIVEKFGAEIAPYAIGLTQNLVAAFWKCISEDEEEDDDTGALAAVGCLRAIATIMECVSGLPQLYPHLEQLLMPIMEKMLASDEQDVYEEVLDILSYLTYYSADISPALWKLFPIMCRAVKEWAMDYFENILVPLDNFIHRGNEMFVSSRDPNYLQMLFEILQIALVQLSPHENPTQQIPLTSEIDAVPAPKLIACVLQHCRGRVDEWVEPYLLLMVQRLRMAEKNHFKCLLITILANALYYNAPLTLQVLHKHGMLQEMFTVWFQLLYKADAKGNRTLFSRAAEKKICAMGLTSLLQLPAEALPLDLQAGMTQVLSGAMTLLVDLKKVEDEEKEERADDDDDEAEEDGDADEEDDDDLDDETAIPEALANMKAKELHFPGTGGRFGNDSDDDDWDEYDDVESAIDAIDPYIGFCETITSIQQNDPSRFQVLTAGFEIQQQSVYHSLMQLAEQKRQEQLAEAAKEAQQQAQVVGQMAPPPLPPLQ